MQQSRCLLNTQRWDGHWWDCTRVLLLHWQFSPLTNWVIWGTWWMTQRRSSALVSSSGMGIDVHSLMLSIHIRTIHQPAEHWLTFFIRARKDPHQSVQQWNCFQRQRWETSEKWCGVHMGFPEHVDTNFNQSELNRHSNSVLSPALCCKQCPKHAPYWHKSSQAHRLIATTQNNLAKFNAPVQKKKKKGNKQRVKRECFLVGLNQLLFKYTFLAEMP